MDEIQQTTCRYCHAVIPADAYFCPNCGKMLREKTTVSRQIVIYFVSLFVPPFGIIYVIRYLRQNDRKSKVIGLIALALTIISSVVSIIMFQDLVSVLNQQLNAIGNLGGGL